MKKTDRIEHTGKITEIGKDMILVEIVNKSACDSCHARGTCGASGESVRIIEVPYTISSLVEDYAVGEEVNVILQSTLGISAVFFAYVLPLIVLILSLLLMPKAGVSELMTGVCSLCLVGVYYFILALFRNRLERVYSFVLEKIQ